MCTIVIVGASGSGKSTIEKELSKSFGYKKIISYTTREPRPDEKNGEDYWFVNQETFREMIKDNLFAEYEEYTEGRLYGTLKADYIEGNNVVVLTPNGVRQIQKAGISNVFTVLVKASLGTRIKRYIDRIGEENFSYSDKNEICSRVDRDYGMFLGIEKQVDHIVYNEKGENIRSIISDILNG